MKLTNSYDPILRTAAKLVELEQIPTLLETFEEMHRVMNKGDGIGLAAPQVGLDLNMFVMNCMGKKRTCINPTVLSTTDEMSTEEEGCLSFPRLKLPISRPFSIVANWIDETGYEHTETLMELEARCFLHEWDHCQGIVFTDRVGKVTLHLARKRARRSK